MRMLRSLLTLLLLTATAIANASAVATATDAASNTASNAAVAAALPPDAASVPAQELPTVEAFTDGMARIEGHFTLFHDQAADKLHALVELAIEPGAGAPDVSVPSTPEFLYVNSLAAGVGSNDIGLDRGQLGDTRVVRFERRGPKLLLVQPNYGYRAVSDNALERRSVREAFASSVLWGFPVVAEDPGTGRVVVDLTPFLMQDAHGVADRLKSSRQGSYSLDASRSALYPEAVLNFPDNTEMEVILTFKGDGQGAWIRSVAPTAEAVTVRQHHSFIRLPDDGYTPRAFDPRAGFYATSFQDYATPVDEPLVKRFIARHRLEKKDPSAAVSEPVEPIVYYLDNGTPEPIRSALLDGARWWNQAFEAAGYRDAFRVEILPEDAHPLDVRYNVIQWVHRSTRGWSYGASVADPRTGEIIKGHVSLGSLRVRQDYLIASGLLGTADERALEMALARIRQLSAHEVGHTIGIMHNFAASTTGDASVMDYPHPQPRLIDGAIDLSRPYDTGIGEWDKLAVRYGYSDFPEGVDERAALDGILRDGYGSGLRYISDSDARAQGGAHPYAHLWDFGADPVAQLPAILDIRRAALDGFGESVIADGRPLAELHDALVPLYFFHRYQVEATVKLVGGLDYAYSVKGEGAPAPAILPSATQRQALAAMLQTLQPGELALPASLLDAIPPRPAGLGSSRELFRGNTGPTIDALGVAQTAAGLTVGLLLHPHRANRLVEYGARAGALSLDEVLDELLAVSWNRPAAGADGSQSVPPGYEAALHRVVDHAVLGGLLSLASSAEANPLTRATVFARLDDLMERLEERGDADARYAAHLIDQFMDEPADFQIPQALPAPPGSPIGMACGEGHWPGL